MARGSGWRWAFVPRWLIDSEAFLCLDSDASDLLFRLYLTCDPYGRFQSGKRSLQRLTGILDAGLFETLSKLEPMFVSLYTVNGVRYGQINGYDEDAPGELTRKRGLSVMPAPEDIRKISGNNPEEGRIDSAQIDKREKTDEEERRSDETDPAGSTRARTRGDYLAEVIR
jgi:hypothetical protein